MSETEDFEGLGLSNSCEGIQNEGLSEIQKDYIDELIPDPASWQNMSLSDRIDSINALQVRINEVADVSGKSPVEVMDTLPIECQEHFNEVQTIEEFGCVECVENGIQVTSDFLTSGKAVEYSFSDIEGRKELCQDFFEDVKGALGIDAKLYFDKMKPNEYGYQSGHEIHLNSSKLENPNPQEILKTILHESRHVLQNDSIDEISPVPIRPDIVSDWSDNMNNYVSPEWDPEGYRKQPVEHDAFSFENYVFAEAVVNYSQSLNNNSNYA